MAEGGRRYFPCDRSRVIKQAIIDAGEPLTARQIRERLFDKYGLIWQTDVSTVEIAGHIRRYMRADMDVIRGRQTLKYTIGSGKDILEVREPPECYGMFGKCKVQSSGRGRCGYYGRCATVARNLRGVAR